MPWSRARAPFCTACPSNIRPKFIFVRKNLAVHTVCSVSLASISCCASGTFVQRWKRSFLQRLTAAKLPHAAAFAHEQTQRWKCKNSFFLQLFSDLLYSVSQEANQRVFKHFELYYEYSDYFSSASQRKVGQSYFCAEIFSGSDKTILNNLPCRIIWLVDKSINVNNIIESENYEKWTIF